jgi:6-phosphogluconolactonase
MSRSTSWEKYNKVANMDSLRFLRWISITLLAAVAITACGGGGGDSGGGGGGGGGGGTNITVPNVVGMTQASAGTAITGAGLKVGTVTMASSSTVASGNVISESPAAGAQVASGSSVNLTVSSGPAAPGTVGVPNVVGDTQAAASTSITGAGLKVGTVTLTSSSTVAAGDVISEAPVAGTQVSRGSSVNLIVSTGAPPANPYAYVSNNALDGSGRGILQGYSVDGSTGALTALTPYLITTGITAGFGEIKFDPTHKFLYVVNPGTDTTVGRDVYGFAIAADGSLTPVANSPNQTDHQPVSLAFDSSGTHLYVANQTDNSISAFTVDTTTGALTELAASPYGILHGNHPAQIATAGHFLYVAQSGSSSVEVFAINPSTGELTEGVTGSPFGTDQGPFALAINPAGTVLYTVALPSGTSTRVISAFAINADGTLTGSANNPQPIPAKNYLGFDSSGKFLLVTENAGIDVYQYNQATGDVGTAVTGSPFAAGTNPTSFAIDASDHVYVGNDGSGNVSEFTLDGTTGALTTISGSPISSGGANPDFIAVQ